MSIISLNTKTIEGVGTFGVMTFEGIEICKTVERDWLNNMPNVSCIPAGTYTLVNRKSPKFGKCYALESKSLGVGITKGLRTHILIHAGNEPSEVQGCIAVGLTWLKNSWGVGDSKSAVIEVERLIEQEGITEIEIVRG